MPEPQTVLVVDDEAAPRELAATFLKKMAYTVLQAGDGKSAVQLAKSHKGDIHLILTDVIMPGMNGSELVDAIRKIRPGIRAAFMSGYGDDLLAQKGVVLEGVILIQKPFTSDELGTWVRVALERPTKART